MRIDEGLFLGREAGDAAGAIREGAERWIIGDVSRLARRTQENEIIMGYVIENGLLEPGIEKILGWRVCDISGLGGIPHVSEIKHNTVVSFTMKHDKYSVAGPGDLSELFSGMSGVSVWNDSISCVTEGEIVCLKVFDGGVGRNGAAYREGLFAPFGNMEAAQAVQ